MTTLFIDPSELRSTSKWPSTIKAVECPGLEELTGADFVVSKLPINPVSNLNWHKQNRSLFVQRKSGYDVFSFEQTNIEIARMKAVGLSMQQCILLFIGRCYPDSSGLAVIDHQKPHGETTYKTFEKRQALITGRGVQFCQIASVAELETWLEARVEAIQDMVDEPVKNVVVKPFVSWQSEDDDLWQEVQTPPKDSPEYSLVCGFDKLGPKRIKAAIQCCQENFMPVTGLNILKVLTQLNEKGKPVFKVAGWADKGIADLRATLGLKTFDNIEIPATNKKMPRWYQNIFVTCLPDYTDMGTIWANGVEDGLGAMEMLIKEHKITNAAQALLIARRAAVSFGMLTKEQVDQYLDQLFCEDWIRNHYPEVYQDFLNNKHVPF